MATAAGVRTNCFVFFIFLYLIFKGKCGIFALKIQVVWIKISSCFVSFANTVKDGGIYESYRKYPMAVK